MIETSAVASLAAVVGEKVLEKSVEFLVVPKFENWVREKQKRAAFERSLSAALGDLERAHPQLAASFFDEHFLKGPVASELALFFSRHRRPDPERVAEEYSRQFSFSTVEARNAAERFLAQVEAHMKSEPALEELLNSRQIEETNRLVRGIAAPNVHQHPLAAIPTEHPQVGIAALTAAFRNVSLDLLQWPQTLGDNEWIPRDTEGLLIERLSGEAGSITMLLGPPGTGKSALLARTAQQCTERGMSVLALRADQLPEHVEHLRDLDRWLDLGMSTIEALERSAAAGETALIIDQLDALSELVVLRSGRLRALIMLIRRASYIDNLHIVTSCRSFERRYDAQLSRIEAEELVLEPLDWAKVAEILTQRGLNMDRWPSDFKDFLRLPQCLKLFLRYYSGGSEARVFRSYQDMFESLWRDHFFRNADRRPAAELLLQLASEMSEHEVLHLPTARYERSREDLNYLVSAGVLKYDAAATQVSFAHQTLFDFTRARAFVANESSLQLYALRSQSSLFMRPIFWSALSYVRATDAPGYRTQFLALWNEVGLREHLRLLLVEFAGMQEAPLDFEIQAMKARSREERYRAKVLFAISARKAWFEAFKADVLPHVMSLPVQDAWPARIVLQQALPFAPEDVFVLIEERWTNDREKREQALLVFSELAQWSDRGAALALRIVKAGGMHDRPVCHVASVASVAAPAHAVRLVAAQLHVRIRAALGVPDERPPVLGENAPVEEIAAAHVAYDPQRDLRKILENSSTDWYDLETMVAASPRTWLEEGWPILREALERASSNKSSVLRQYDSDSMIATKFDESDEEARREYPVLGATLLAVREVAKTDADWFIGFANRNKESSAMAVHRLLALGLAEASASYASFALGYLLEDPRRLQLENFEHEERETKMVIHAIVRHLSAEERLKLEQFIMQASEYRPDHREDDPSARFERQKWTREFRLRLLQQFPEGLLTEAGRRYVRDQLSAFQRSKDEPKVTRILRPANAGMSAEQMAKANDRDLLNFWLEVPDDTGWGEGIGRRRSSINASNEFGKFAKLHPKRALGLIEQLPAETHERPLARALQEIDSNALPLAELLALTKRLQAKGFKSSFFREAVASSLAKRAHLDGLPDDAIDLLEGWLAEHPVLEDVRSDASEETRDENDRSLLWPHGGIKILPHRTYPILSAILEGLILRNPPEGQRAISILTLHLARKDALRIWENIADDLSRRFHRYEAHSFVAFIRDLIRVYPDLLKTRAGVFLIAHALHFASPEIAKEWLLAVRSTGADNAHIAFGELLFLLTAVNRGHTWARDELELLIRDAPGAEGARAKQLLGTVHGAVHLWKDVSQRGQATRVVAASLRGKAASAAHAALDWFRLTEPVRYSDETKPIFEALAQGSAWASAASLTFVVEGLLDVVQDEPELVHTICTKIIDAAGVAMSSVAHAASTDAEVIVNIAMAMQRMDEPHRTNGLDLFEKLVQLNAYRTRDVLRELDRRPEDASASPPRRRRRRRVARVG